MKFAENPIYVDGADQFTIILYTNGSSLQFNPSDLGYPCFIFENSSVDGFIYLHTQVDFEVDLRYWTVVFHKRLEYCI